MDEQQQLLQMGQQIIQAAQQGDQQANEIIQTAQQAMQDQNAMQQIMQAAQQGDENAVAVASVIMVIQSQTQMARFGAKLNYIKFLRGKCPKGYEMQYFKTGGCMKCKKKEEGGQVVSAQQGDPVSAFKCGRKMKKKAKGGNVNKSACGDKINKHLLGGKQRRPFTGFEGLSYRYSAPRPSSQGRSDRPESEDIYNNGNYVIGRDRYYDPDLYEASGKLEPVEDWSYGTGPSGDLYATPSEINSFNSLRRHALMNSQFSNNSRIIIPQDKFGSKIKKNN